MPVAAVTNILTTGFIPMFTPGLAPETTADAAQQWAQAYTGYAFAGGITAAATHRSALAAALAVAFDPVSGNPDLFLQALAAFWIGLPVPEQVGTVTSFVASDAGVASSVAEDAGPADLARGLALVIASLTLGSVFVTVPGPAVVPLL